MTSRDSRSRPAALDIGLLGPLEVRVNAEPVPTSGPKLRAIVAQLALAAGRVVAIDDLLYGVWGEDLPNTARNTLQYHVSVLRKILAVDGADALLLTREPGYLLDTATDVDRFAGAAAAGARARSAGNVEQAAAAFADALNEWRGHALADVRDFPFAETRAVALEGQRLTCLEGWVDAELACGRAEDLVPALQSIISENPTRERLWEQLMIALYRTGRQDAALLAFRNARATLDRELGVAPSERLQEVQRAILRQDPKLAPVRALRTVTPRKVTSTVLAQQLPPSAPPSLVGPSGVRVALGAVAVVLGRDEGCDLVLADDEVSRRHAEVRPTPHGYELVDLHSTNGTYVNDQRASGPVLLADGDRIGIGSSTVRFVAPSDVG